MFDHIVHSGLSKRDELKFVELARQWSRREEVEKH